MKINSQDLYEFINNLATNEKVKFNVYCDDQYVTQIYWNGECFEWAPGLFSSEAFFNPLYDFVVIEDNKKIEKIKDKYCSQISKVELAQKINEIIDKLNEVEK